jgi:signal transduction histidine kinase
VAVRFAVLPGPGGERVLVAPERRDPRTETAFGTILSLNAELATLARELSWRNREVERARARAEAAEREAVRMRRLQEQLAAIVAHDLRTPLSSITMSAAALRRRGVQVEQEQLVARILASAARMGEIVGDLLDLTRARQGLGILERAGPADVGELCSNIVQEHLATRPDARIELRTEGDTRATVDASRISQAIANLVGNALQHGDAGGVDVTVTGDEREVVVVVHNGGATIPPDLLPELFEPFRQGPAPHAGSRPRGSVGLGLYIAGEIVHSHGGRIEVQSEPAKGTWFTVRLPRGPHGGAPHHLSPPAAP